MTVLWLALPGLCIWAAILCLPWRPWSTREFLDADPGAAQADLGALTILIPARNEAGLIEDTLRAAAAQGSGHRLLVIDDQSTDGTGERAMALGLPGTEVLPGAPLPEGWTGKLWALEQGRRRATTPLVLLLDADIELCPGTVAALVRKMSEEDLGLVSLMARLRMENAWERLLMPAFIYFFKLLYPFGLSNARGTPIAAAAGGCILVKREALEKIGGFSAVRGELIDDCALARAVKRAGYGTWIGLTHSAVSRRPYPGVRSIWDMVARTAYTQLRHSPLLLALCTVLMVCAFVLPVIALFVPGAAAAGILALLLMAAGYVPTLRFYELGIGWAAAMPVAGALFLLMTWGSAVRHWQGAGALWKDRSYAHTVRTR